MQYVICYYVCSGHGRIVQTFLYSQESTTSFPKRHVLDFLAQRPPIIRLQLRIFDSLLAPVLVQPAHEILRLLEKYELVPNTFFDENAPSVLVYDGLFIL